MKLRDLRQTQQDAYIQEMSELFVAYGYYNTMLSEGQLDEAGAWEKVKSMVGKGISGVKTANDAINKLGALAQNTAPVQGFDNKVDGLLKKIGDANPKVAELATKYGEWAKKNPVKQGLIIGMLTAVASLVAGPAGGAAAGAVLRAGNELLKGEKASTAIGKGAKGAAVGALAGAAASAITGPIANILSSWRIKEIPMPSMPELIANEIEVNGKKATIMMLKSDKDALRNLSYDFLNLRAQVGIKSDESLVNNMKSVIREMIEKMKYFQSKEYANKIASVIGNYEAAKEVAINNDYAYKIINNISKTIDAAAQGAGTAANTDSSKGAKPAAKTAAPATQSAAAAPDRRAELKAKQQAWQAQQRRMGKLK